MLQIEFSSQAPLERRIGSHTEGRTEHLLVAPLASQIFTHSI